MNLTSKRILVPVDPEHDSFDALLLVRGMSAEWPVQVTLLHVVNLNIVALDRRVFDELCVASEKFLRKLAEKIFGDSRAVEVSVRLGKPPEEIVAEAKAGLSELIVLTSPRPSRWKKILGLDTVANVLRNAPCPTLVLPRVRETLGTANNSGGVAEKHSSAIFEHWHPVAVAT